MKSTGITRPLDGLGRVVIPKDLREILRLKKGDMLEVLTANGGLIIFRRPGCMFCGDNENTIPYKGNRICERCIKTIGKLGTAYTRGGVT